MTATPSQTRPRRSRGLRLVFSCILFAGLIGLVAVAELAAARLYRRLAPESGRKAVEALLSEQAAAQGHFIQHPYLFYAFRPNLHAFGMRQFNNLGHRGDDVPAQPEPDEIRILCIGGSTTASFPYIPDPKNAWPARLQELLRSETGRRVVVINAGLNAANSADLLAHYIFRNRYLGAHVVVLHVGGNDANALFFEKYHPEYTHFTTGWRSSALQRRRFEDTWLRSHMVRWLYALWLQHIDLEAQLGRASIRDLPPHEALNITRRHEPNGFRRNLDALVRAIRSDGAEPVFVPFVWAPEARFRRDTLFGPYYDAFITAFEKNRRVIDELSLQHDVRVAEVPQDAFRETHFKDWCHLNAEGDAIKALHIARSIAPFIATWAARKDPR